jgi:2,5-diamino-6-(ribosylamino)-4(3H)-pyrimidinone 5'-phosphate reductase
MKDRPFTTLFLLTSVDGKISTGASDALDVDKDFPSIEGVREGLHQYYEIEETTGLWSLNTGRVMRKIGVNGRKDEPGKMPVSFVIIDNRPHLNEDGVAYLCKWVKQLIIVTTNRSHPAFSARNKNLSVLYQQTLDLPGLLRALREEYGVERLTVQSGGTLNGALLHQKLLDSVDIVVAPVLIGGKDTSSLIDGKSLVSPEELNELGVLKLEQCDVLENSYLRLRYRVVG